MIDSHDEHWRGIVTLGRSRNNDLLRRALAFKVLRSFWSSTEDTSCFYNVLNSAFSPWNVLGVPACKHLYGAAVYFNATLAVGNGTLEPTVNAIIFELVCSIL